MIKANGFSLLETVIAMGIMMVVTAAMFTVMSPSQGRFSVELEEADVQQRLRVAQDTLYKDLIMAGAGAYLGPQITAGALNYYFAPVLPFRQGAVNDDGAATFHTDRITLFYVPPTTAQTTTTTTLSRGSGPAMLQVKAATNCPKNVNLCGFTAGMTVLIFDDRGNYDTFYITAVNDSSAEITVNRPPDSTTTTYPANSKVVQAVHRVYYLKSTPSTNSYQLMRYDGSTNADVPVVDHVVGLKFDYYGDPRPPRLRKPLADPTGPWTTYGPKPPALGSRIPGHGYPAGENCVFQVDAAGDLQLPRLTLLGSGSNPNSLVLLTASQLTDGPWCPDEASTNRWDADLLRLRKIGVTLRVEAAVDALRGPAGVLFTRAGSSTGATRRVPDQEIRFTVSPRNLNLGR